MLVVSDFKLASALGDDFYVSGTFFQCLDNYQSAPEARYHIRDEKTKVSSLVVSGRLIAGIVIPIENFKLLKIFAPTAM